MTNVLGAALVCVTVSVATITQAATIDVTTKSDTVSDDGFCSLREAISAANTGNASGRSPGECAVGNPLPVVDLIRVPPGTYRLSRGGPGEDRNAGGDLDITQSVVIQGAGRAQTIVRNAIGDPTVRGDGDRLFHADPAGTGGVDVTLRALTMTDGDVGCTGEGCTTGASAVEAAGAGALTLVNTRVMKNRSFCSGDGCGNEDAAAIRAGGGGALTIRRSLIKRNRGTCEGDECTAGSAAIQMYDTDTSAGDFVLENTAVKANLGSCVGALCYASATIEVHAREITVRATKISWNTNACFDTGCLTGEAAWLDSDGHATIEATDLRDNATHCEGEDCGTSSLLSVDAETGTVLRDVLAERNSSRCVGLGCSLSEHIYIETDEGDVAVDGLRVDGSESSCTGDDCEVEDVVRLEAPGEVTLADAVVTGARGTCAGANCDTRALFTVDAAKANLVRSQFLSNYLTCSGQSCDTLTAIYVYGSPAGVALQDTSIAENSSVCFGTDCTIGAIAGITSATGDVTLERTDVSNNIVSCGSGDRCSAGGVLSIHARLAVGAEAMSLRENLASCYGRSCRIAPIAHLGGYVGGVAVDGVVVDANVALCEGQECHGAEVFSFGFGAASSLDNGSFTANRSECAGAFCVAGYGGALHNAVRPLTVTDTTFSRNVTDGWGAAVYNDASAELIFDRVVMTENRANLDGPLAFGGYGGAIFNDAADGHFGVLRLFSSEIRGNQAGATGGGICNEGMIASFTGTTLTANQPNNCLNSGGTGCP